MDTDASFQYSEQLPYLNKNDNRSQNLSIYKGARTLIQDLK